MFQKKDIIYNETIGVCQVTEVTKLVDKRGQPIMYYGLKSLQDGRTAYIPVENHSVVLRNLIDTDTAVERKNTGFKDRRRQEQYEINYVLGGIKCC